MKKILELLNAISPLSPSLVDHLRANIKPRRFSKGEYILKEGEVCQHVYFLESGLIRIFDQQEDKDNTSWLLMEGDIFISVTSFFQQQPADENILALEDCNCWGIHYRQLQKICKEFEEFNVHRQTVTERYYCPYRDRAKILTLPPSERYAYLIEKEPELLGRVPLNILSTYLNLSQRTFNRVRNNYYESKRKIVH